MLPPERSAQYLVLTACLGRASTAATGCTCSFHEQLRPLEQEHDGVIDLLVRDRDHVVEQLVQDRSGQGTSVV